MAATSLRAVAFDLWGTLIRDAPGGGRRRMLERERRLGAAYERAGAGSGAAAAVPQAIRAAIDALVVAHQSNIDLSGQDRLNAFRAAMLERCPTTVEDDELLSAIEQAICESASWEPPDIIAGAEQTLAELSERGLRLAVVSNTGLAPGRYVEQALCSRGFERWIDAWVWSDDVLSWKPGQAIFAATLEQLDVSAAETAFVGDTPEADILGAQHAQFAVTVQVGDKRDPAIEADLMLDSVANLVAALEGQLSHSSH